MATRFENRLSALLNKRAPVTQSTSDGSARGFSIGSRPWAFNQQNGTILNRNTGKVFDCKRTELHRGFLVKFGTEGTSRTLLLGGITYAFIDAGEVDYGTGS